MYRVKIPIILPIVEESICIAEEELLHLNSLPARLIGETSSGESFSKGEPSVRKSITGVEG